MMEATMGQNVEDTISLGDEQFSSPESENPQFNSLLSPRSLQIKLQISLPNLPSPTMSSPRSGRSQYQRGSGRGLPVVDACSSQQVRDMPQIVSIYDSLPAQLKSYFLLHLLKRSPMPTLQFVLSLVTPTLKRDFFALLPPELCFRILSYLDIATIGRCHYVSKVWYNLLSGVATQQHLWKERLKTEGWLLEQFDDPSYGDTMGNIYSNDYKSMYKRHYVIRKNWMYERYKQISFQGHSFNVVTCLQFDSRRIVSGSDDQTIHIYDIRTGNLLRRLCGHEGGVWALQYWNDSLVSGSTDRTVRVWNMNTGECTNVFEGHTSTVRCLIIITPSHCPLTNTTVPDRPLIVTGSRDSTLRVWTLPSTNPSGPHIREERDPEYVTGATNNLRSSSQHIPNQHFIRVLQGHTNSVRAIAGKCNFLVSGSYDATVRFWDISTGKCIYVFRGHREKVYSVDYCHSLQKAASGSLDTTVRVWCTRTGVCLFSLEGHSSLVGLLEMSPKLLISAAADATLRIWCVETGQCLANLKGHMATITCFQHDVNLNRIVSGSEGGIKVWELCSEPQALSNDVSASSSKPVYGRFISNLVVCVQGVWRVKMSERYLVTAVQKEEGKTWFEVLDFGYDENSPQTLPSGRETTQE